MTYSGSNSHFGLSEADNVQFVNEKLIENRKKHDRLNFQVHKCN